VIGKIRPQVMMAIIAATVFGCLAAVLGYKMGATEILTAIIGSLLGFLSGVSLRIVDLESDGDNE
tara:strand:+ start:318 stop:512 length:195 start_codon:yes stop_codon:yes gene_type:complete